MLVIWSTFQCCCKNIWWLMTNIIICHMYLVLPQKLLPVICHCALLEKSSPHFWYNILLAQVSKYKKWYCVCIYNPSYLCHWGCGLGITCGAWGWGVHLNPTTIYTCTLCYKCYNCIVLHRSCGQHYPLELWGSNTSLLSANSVHNKGYTASMIHTWSVLCLSLVWVYV